MPVFSADLLFPVTSDPIPNGWIELNNEGIITAIGASQPPSDAKHLKGILIPGLVNAHCHLELSFLRQRISVNAGMTGFVKQLLSIRNSTPAEDQAKGMTEACTEMQRNGIVAVGDISNNTLSSSVKSNSRLSFRTFIEVLGLSTDMADNIFNAAIQMINDFEKPADLTLHATYSISEKLTEKVARHLVNSGSPLSIHMQESEDELQICKEGKGPLAELLAAMGIPPHTFRKYNNAPVLFYADLFKNIERIIFVHNTFTSEGEIKRAEAIHDGITWCLCPKANRYITGTLPPVDALSKSVKRIAIGTDSLASNDSLDILSELKVLAKNFSFVSLDDLIQWSTINGAFALKMEDRIGSLETGKNPGLNLLENINASSPVITEKTTVRPIFNSGINHQN